MPLFAREPNWPRFRAGITTLPASAGRWTLHRARTLSVSLNYCGECEPIALPMSIRRIRSVWSSDRLVSPHRLAVPADKWFHCALLPSEGGVFFPCGRGYSAAAIVEWKPSQLGVSRMKQAGKSAISEWLYRRMIVKPESASYSETARTQGLTSRTSRFKSGDSKILRYVSNCGTYKVGCLG